MKHPVTFYCKCLVRTSLSKLPLDVGRREVFRTRRKNVVWTSEEERNFILRMDRARRRTSNSVDCTSDGIDRTSDDILWMLDGRSQMLNGGQRTSSGGHRMSNSGSQMEAIGRALECFSKLHGLLSGVRFIRKQRTE